MQRLVYAGARDARSKKRGLKLKTRVNGNSIIIQAILPKEIT